MKTSAAFKKGYPIKTSEVNKVRGQIGLQKYLNESIQDKKGYKIYTTKPQNSKSRQEKIKITPQLASISSSNIPVLSPFQKKIRQAIQSRYQKSKINQFKYQKVFQSHKQKQSSSPSFSSERKYRMEEESQKSQDMEEMKQFAHLKSHLYISIHHYHASKGKMKRQSTLLRENIRKRKFKVMNSKSIQAKEQQLHGHSNSIQKIQVSPQFQRGLNTISPKQSKPIHLDLKGFNNQKLQNAKNNQEEKRKSLTSRPSNTQNQVNQVYNAYGIYQQTQSNTKTKPASHMIKDTFKLKGPNSLKKNQYQLIQFDNQSINGNSSSNYQEEKSGRSLNNKRRFLLHKNQKHLKTLQNNIHHQTNNKFYPNHYQRIPKTQNKKVFSSLKKIETEITQTPQINQRKTPSYKKTTKEKIKTNPNRTHEFQQNESQLSNSTTQHKWKLQEISFRFKAIDQERTQFPVQKTNNLIGQNEKALKMGFSLQKAYKKILSGRKIEKKQNSNLDHKRTIVSKNDQNVYTTQTIQYQQNIDREQRSVSKNKRRKLRLRTEADLQPDERNSKVVSTAKNSNRNLQASINSTIIQNSSKESANHLKQKQKREYITANYQGKQKIERFSTIG